MKFSATICGVTLLCGRQNSEAYTIPSQQRQQRQQKSKSTTTTSQSRSSLLGRRNQRVAPILHSSVAVNDLESKAAAAWPRRVFGRVFAQRRQKIQKKNSRDGSLKLQVQLQAQTQTQAMGAAVRPNVKSESTSSASVLSKSTARERSEHSVDGYDFIRNNFEKVDPADLLCLSPLEIGDVVDNANVNSNSHITPSTGTSTPLADFTWSAEAEVMELFPAAVAAASVPSVSTAATATLAIDVKTDESEQAELAAAAVPTTSVKRRLSPFTHVTNTKLENILAKLFNQWSRGDHQGMDVRCVLKSNVRDLLLRGQICCDARVDLGRINFNTIRLSGGTIEARRLALNLWSFAPGALVRQRSPRFPNQFDLLAHNVTLKQDDLMQSPCIRNGLRRLLTRILHGRGMNAMFVKIDDMIILKSGKLSVQATATTILGQRVPFEVRTRLGTASRGYVLTFPDLEISLSGFHVPVLPEVTVDLGHNAQLLSVNIDGSSRTIQLSARVTITPEHTMKIPNYSQSKRSYAALCSVDVGRWLTRLGRFSF